MSYPGYYSNNPISGYYSNDQISAAVERCIQNDLRYRNDFQSAMVQHSRSWLQWLIRTAVLTVLGVDILGIFIEGDVTSWLGDIVSDLPSWCRDIWDTFDF